MNLILWWLLVFLILFYIKIYFYFDISWKEANEVWVEWLNLMLLILIWLLLIFIVFIFDIYNKKTFILKEEKYLKMNHYLYVLIILLSTYILYWLYNLF